MVKDYGIMSVVNINMIKIQKKEEGLKGTKMRRNMRLVFNRFLNWCVEREDFPSYWRPPVFNRAEEEVTTEEWVILKQILRLEDWLILSQIMNMQKNGNSQFSFVQYVD